MTRLFRHWMLPLACLAILTIGNGHGQPQPPEEPTRTKALLKSDPPPPQAADPPAAPARQTPPASVDDLITRLEKLRQQKAELEKQEREVVEQLREIVKSQADRLSKLGISLGGPDLKEAGNRPADLPPLPKK
jgi:hypothetical protein